MKKVRENGLFITTQQLFAKLKQERACENKRGCSSEKEHKVNALAPRAEEGRDYLRKAAASWK